MVEIDYNRIKSVYSKNSNNYITNMLKQGKIKEIFTQSDSEQTSLTTNNVSQSNKNVKSNTSKYSISNPENNTENSKASSFSLEEQLEKYVYPQQVYKQYEKEDKTKITSTIEELKKYKETLDADTDADYSKYFETNQKIKALEAGFDNVYDYYVENEKSRLREEAKGKYGLGYSLLQEGIKKEKTNNQLQRDIENSTPLQNAQFQIIQETNPAPEDNYVWIRSPKDIKTFEEAIDDPESFSFNTI